MQRPGKRVTCLLTRIRANGRATGRSHRFRTLSKIDQPSARALEHYSPMKELSLKNALAVSCPTCGAAPGEECEINTGQPRTDPHRGRRLVAKTPAVTQNRVRLNDPTTPER